MSNVLPYIILIIAVALGTAANGFAKSAQGFTLLVPSLMTAVTIVGCMYTLSLVMKTIPVGVTYASFAGLCIIATIIIGIIKFNQMPDLYTILGMILIISGVFHASLCPLSIFIISPVILLLLIKNLTPLHILSKSTFFFNSIDLHCFLKCLSDCLLFFNVGPGEIPFTLILGANFIADVFVRVTKEDLLKV